MADHRNGSAQPHNGKVGAAGAAYSIDLDTFQSRLKSFYSHWDEHKTNLWGSSDAITIGCPPPSDDLRYLKSTALNLWLLGFEFPDTIMVFMKKQIHILCSQKKASILETVRKPAKEAVGAEVIMHIKAKNDDGIALMDAIFRAVRAQLKVDCSDVPTVGYISREAPEGKLLETWAEKLKSTNFQLIDVANGLSSMFSVKNNEELTSIKRASYLTTSVMKNFVVPKLENVIDDEKKISHSTLMEDTEKVILEPSKVNCKLKADNVDICYPPIFQSGGEFDLRPSAVSNDELLHYDSASVIICAVGARYKSYCSNIARTFLIDADPLQSKAYEVLLKAHEAAIGSLKPGNKMSAAYLAAVSVVEKDAPELVSNLTKSAGTGIGIEFRESGLNLNAKNEQIVKEGMVFNVTLGFQNLQSQSSKAKSKNFSLLLADTVIIVKDKAEVVTSLSSKALKDVAYSFNEDDDEEEKPSKKAETKGTEPIMSKTTLRSDNHEISKEELRRQHQAELARQKNEETARRLAGGACLVELIETPFLVVTLSEIEIVNLERVGLGQKNFDMTIVFKDFKRDVFRIDSIPSTSLDGIKEWLDTTDIKYYESRLNLNWRQILKTITDDPQSFIEGGGWEFLNLEATDSESENSEESDKGYEPSDVEPESDSEDDASDSESLVESEDEEEEDSEEDSEEEKGKTWEELEREASNADREKGDESDSEEERKRRKIKALGKSRSSISSSMPKRTKLR
ncbi:FACT complex subunit SPT16-like [Senna tora]|uniref:FACT complex subunit n=1 Tax=Senna tora TaxID=362788 RepID=A0A834X9M2_9FABA|nr:FACT complex subunit SPT16-like [Senna tora]